MMDNKGAKDQKTAIPKVIDEKKAVESHSMEEDDEFEEFPQQDWQAKEGAEDEEELNVWEDNWDDEANENDFAKQLREELAKHGHGTVA